MRKLVGLMTVVTALGLLGVSASGADAANPFENGCKEGLVCIWSEANYKGQLSWWSEGEPDSCKAHEKNLWFRSFFNATSHDVVTFGGAGKYNPHSGNPNPGALDGLVCITYGV
ncbi:MAG: peptidase inhibitor family I36 protein [Solirubrobacteraceae bacterium]